MVVKRIVANIATGNVKELRAFYVELFALDVVMDQGWIVTLAGATDTPAQMSIASQGGAGTPVPDISIEVDDIDAVYARASETGQAIEYPLTHEPWGVRRFYLRDPAGKLLNIMMHMTKT